MPATAQYKCKCCGTHFEARTADRARGWARFCSKGCKAIKQTRTQNSSRPRHDGRSPMKHKLCDTCGAPAINGVYSITGKIEWGCELHHDTTHPFSDESF